MELVICILKDYRRVEDVLLGFIELGITGATVVEARGMAQLVGGQHPLFASVRGLFPGSTHDSHLSLAAMDAAQVETALALIDRVTGGLDQPGRGVVFTVPVRHMRGRAAEIS